MKSKAEEFYSKLDNSIDFTSLSSTGINTNYENVFKFAELYANQSKPLPSDEEIRKLYRDNVDSGKDIHKGYGVTSWMRLMSESVFIESVSKWMRDNYQPKQLKTPEEMADEAMVIFYDKGWYSRLPAHAQIDIQEALRIASGKYNQPKQNAILEDWKKWEDVVQSFLRSRQLSRNWYEYLKEFNNMPNGAYDRPKQIDWEELHRHLQGCLTLNEDGTPYLTKCSIEILKQKLT